MIATELFKPDQHYKAVCEWWTAQNWPVLPLTHLSQNGIVVCVDGKPAAACWIFKTDSAWCLLEFIVADPSVRRETRANVLSVLISTAKLVAKMMGFGAIFLSVKSQSLAARLEKQGFKANDTGVTSFTFNLMEEKPCQ